MPIFTTCPSCGRALRVPDNLIGADVRCPGCETIFQASAGAPEPADPLAERSVSPPAETATYVPSQGVREIPSASEPQSSASQPQNPASDGIREPADTGIRDESAPRSIPLPPPPEFDEDEADDEEEMERLEEIHRRRRRGMLREEARSKLNAPGIGLIVTGVMSILYGLFNVGQFALFMANMPPAPNDEFLFMQIGMQFGQALLNFVLGGLIIRGAIKMRRLESYGLAMTACILGIVPCHGCCILGMIFGIWGLVLLNDPDVKGSFMAGPEKARTRDQDHENAGENQSRNEADHQEEI